ncbi:MAG: FG-GAP-like repeat-containing protein [Kiritimatiellaeota bacterium]|nr:FG-GAP-like repeat-containing protein [Kiritimatiellota bacterium]
MQARLLIGVLTLIGWTMVSGDGKEPAVSPKPVITRPIASALQTTKHPGGNVQRVIDGDTSDASVWNGFGCPVWVEVELPEPVELARVVVHPGNRKYAAFPSTECSPEEFTLQGWVQGSWRNLAPPVKVPRYTTISGSFFVTVDVPPVTLKRFRLYITALHDGGFRVDHPGSPDEPLEDRATVIREIQWYSVADVAAARVRMKEWQSTVGQEIRWWGQALSDRHGATMGRTLKTLYAEELRQLGNQVAILARPDAEDQYAETARRWEDLKAWLEPWRPLVASRWADWKTWLMPWQLFMADHRGKVEVSAVGSPVGRLELSVDPGQTPHKSYPASCALDLRVLEALWGRPVDPYVIQVYALEPDGKHLADIHPGRKGAELNLCASRFERISPCRGFLVWTIPDREHTRYVVEFGPRPDAPPEKGMMTVGDGDGFYFDAAPDSTLPGNTWSAVFLDWDGDGRQDAITGRGPDFCHFWKNIGTKDKPVFSEREHWLVRDVTGAPIAASADHHGIAMSVVQPVDFDGDGRVDLFMSRYLSGRPAFYRNLGPSDFPVVASPTAPVNLTGDKMAFGDLDGDGQADAVVITSSSNVCSLLLQPGRGLGKDGAPRFADARPLGISLPLPGTLDRSYCRPAPALADIDADGDLDVFLVVAPNVWFYENIGTSKEPKFAEGRLVEREGVPLDVGYYYPSITWSDYDGDGDLDLVKSTGVEVYLNEGNAKTLRLGQLVRPVLKQQQRMERANLRAFDMVDFDKDGDLDHVLMAYYCMDLEVDEWQDGLFRRSFVVNVDPEKKDWYGCPDLTEYYALYGNVQLVDFDGDGDLDVAATSEHSWRFGYIHYYENLGTNGYAPEVEWRPMATCDYVRFVEGKNGQGAHVDAKTFLDFLSYRTKDSLDSAGGSLSFWFQPDWDATDGNDHYFFYTAPTPAAAGINSGDLASYYEGIKPDLVLPKPFALFKTKAGTLQLQMGKLGVETPVLDWQTGSWHRVETHWGKEGCSVAVDGRRLAESAEPVTGVPVGRRMWVGSRAWMGVQREREYPGRWKCHPVDMTDPVDGVLDDFEIRNAKGQALFTLAFNGNADSAQGQSGARTKLGYRCAPGYADFNGDGLTDMVAMISDGRRGHGSGSEPEHRNWGDGVLILFPNVGTAAKPRWGEGIPLKHTDGTPFRCHIRTKITPVDWNRDGRVDLILSAANSDEDAEFNRAVDLFMNTGTKTAPVFGPRQPMDRLNSLLNAHHDVKLEAVDLAGNGEDALVTSTDPGTCVFYRSFLEEDPVRVRVVAVEPGL